MKVIKWGNQKLDTDWIYQLTCKPIDKGVASIGCGAELEINYLDVYKEVSRSDQVIKIAFCTKCPVCGETLLVPYSEIPKHLAFKTKDDWLKAKKESLLVDLFELDTSQAYKLGITDFCESIGIESEELSKFE